MDPVTVPAFNSPTFRQIHSFCFGLGLCQLNFRKVSESVYYVNGYNKGNHLKSRPQDLESMFLSSVLQFNKILLLTTNTNAEKLSARFKTNTFYSLTSFNVDQTFQKLSISEQ